MRSTGLRKLVAAAVHEELLARLPKSWGWVTHLVGNELTVTVRLWWPWWLLLGAAHLIARRWVRLIGERTQARMQVPVLVRVRVESRKRRPKKR